MVRTKKGLTERHQKILDYLDRRQTRQGYPPSIREIGEATGISSTSVVTYYLRQLEEMGMIERDHRVSRGVRLPHEIRNLGTRAGEVAQNIASAVEEMLRIPIAGRIVASAPAPVPGSSFSYYDAESSVEIARSLLPSRDTSELYALEVEGDSMIDAMVNSGDIVVMKKASKANNGDMVAVWLNDKEETTLKYFYHEGKRVRLQPANPTMGPIYIDDPRTVEIQGKVVMVIRRVDSLAA
ncbi:MAG: repressor LexA [Chloroflexi bacterium]|nr:repressor LexA [Chloroflexota bacterium]